MKEPDDRISGMKTSVRSVLFCTMVLIIFIPVSLRAEDITLPVAADFTSRLGWTPDEAITWLGAPEGLFPYRGRVEGEDNVVFYYPDHLYLFWFRDRVWQVRVDERWNGEVDGVRMGMSLDDIIALWGSPINEFDEAPTWTLPDRGYPVRLRLFIDEEGKLIDLYVFRSDW